MRINESNKTRKYEEIKIIENKEYIRYTQDMEGTISFLEQSLRQTDDTEEIAICTLQAACEFYQGDLCAVLDIDLELNMWKPLWWYTQDGQKSSDMKGKEYKSVEIRHCWTSAMKKGQTVIMPDVETIKESYPEEYTVYKRMGIKALIGVPLWRKQTGYFIIRNPKRYKKRSSMLQFLAFVVIASVNERKIMEHAELACTGKDIHTDTDIIVHLFGELEIYTSKGVLKESDMKSPKISRIVTYMILSQKRMISPREIAETIWPKESIDMDNPGKNIKGLLYRFRQMFGLISEHNLIESTPNGYRLNPELHIKTDYEYFDVLCNNAQKTLSLVHKVDMLKRALELYKGEILFSASGEQWLMHTALHYNLRYLGAVNELLKALAEAGDYEGVYYYASAALKKEPENKDAYFWLIISMCRQGASELAKAELKMAKSVLQNEEYEELAKSLRTAIIL